jgi:acetylornithine/succinyldiaminopimelate/putrescine aminotransferase
MSTLSYNPVLGHITTFGGHPVSCAAALGALSVLSENKIVETVEHKSELFQSLLTKHKAVLEIRRSGLLIAVELGAFEKVLTFIKYALEEGVITDWFLFCNTAVRIAPPLTITNDQIREVCSSLLRVLNRL